MTPSDLGGPGRPAPGAQRTSPRTLIFSGISLVAGVVLFFVEIAVRSAVTASTSSTAASSSSGSRPAWFLFIFIFVLIVRPIFEVTAWFFRTYTVNDSEIIIDEGVLSRHHRVIPFARVQQVDLDQKLTAQILGVQVVRISSAGEAGATTLSLHSLERTDAEQLRAFILRRREELHAGAAQHAPRQAPRPSASTAQPPPARPGFGPPPGPVAPPASAWVVGSDGLLATPPPIVAPTPAGGSQWQPPPPPTGGPSVELLHLSSGRLALAGLTDSQVLAVPAVAFVVTLWIIGFTALNKTTPLLLSAFGIAVAILVGIAVLVIAGQILDQTVKKHDFTLTAQGDDLHIKHGLFDVRQITIPRRRVQQITVLDNPLRRFIGVASLRLHSASLTSGAGTTSFDIPILATAELEPFLMRLMGTSAWQLPTLEPRNERARMRAVTRRVAGLALVLIGPAIMLPPNGPILLAFAFLGIPWGFVAHRRAGHGRSSQIVSFAHGVFQHRVDLVPISRIQSCRTTASPFQRRVGLATIRTDIAAAREAPHLYDIDAEVATELLNVLPRVSSPTATVNQAI